MADLQLSLWLERDPPPEAAAGPRGLARAAAGPEKLRIEFLGADRVPLGPPLEAPVPAPVRVEVPSGEAGFQWTATTPPVTIPAGTVADEAVAVRASLRGRTLAELPLAAARAASPGPPAARRSFNPAGTWKLLLVSESFPDAAGFFAAAAQLHAFILASAPFADPAAAAKFQVEALFWPSGAAGLFNTKVDGRLVFGDNDLVQRFVRAGGSKGKLTLVLVNSGVRGGAGGARDRPAWVTTASAPGERWEAVALHELGHSFGLADEYDDDSQPADEPSRLEPNVTKNKKGSRAPWAALCTPGFAHDPTCDASVQPPAPANTVGTFEGARYRKKGRYRPTVDCLMRMTNQPFCPVCQAHIRKVLAAA